MPSSPQAVGTPFYCYSTATLRAALPRVRRRLRGRALARLLRHEGEFQPGGDRDAGAARRRRRRGLGRRTEARARRRHSARARSCSPASARPRDELAAAVDAGILCINVESEPELALLSQIAAAKGRTVCVSLRVNPDVDAKTHAKIATGKSENKFGIPISRAREVYAQAGKAQGRARRRRRHAYRQPDHRPAAVRRCLRAALRFRAHAARRRPSHRACRSRRRARHSLSRGQRAAARSRRLCGGGEARDARSRLHADLRARPHDRRQCRHPGRRG